MHESVDPFVHGTHNPFQWRGQWFEIPSRRGADKVLTWWKLDFNYLKEFLKMTKFFLCAPVVFFVVDFFCDGCTRERIARRKVYICENHGRAPWDRWISPDYRNMGWYWQHIGSFIGIHPLLVMMMMMIMIVLILISVIVYSYSYHCYCHFYFLCHCQLLSLSLLLLFLLVVVLLVLLLLVLWKKYKVGL